MVDLRVTGAEDLSVLAKRLREAGRKDLQKELYRGINRALKPMKADVKSLAGDFLPDQYAAEMTKSLRVQTRTRSTGKGAGVRLVGSAKTKHGTARSLATLNRGRLRHLSWGRLPWEAQTVKPGWWDKPLSDHAPTVRMRILEAMRTVARKVESG